MSDLYLDEIEKIKYFKEKIINRYLSQGIAADKEKVQEFLDQIDMKLAIFSQSYIQSGSTFDPERFNQQKQDIYRDLTVLYLVLYKLVKERLTATEARVQYLINALQKDSDQFKFLVDYQSVSIYGKTIFHQSSNFNQEYENGRIVINLGEISVPSGSYLACLFQCAEADQEDITFYFDDESFITAYGNGARYLQVLGNYGLNTENHANESVSFGKDIISTNMEISEKNKYYIFMNRDQVKIKRLDYSASTYAVKQKETYYTLAAESEISFYVYGASYIQFDTVGTIEYASFTENIINHPAQRQKVVIRAAANFSFDILTDGTVYAEKAGAVVRGNELRLMQDYAGITDYMIEEVAFGDDIVFDDVKIVIDNAEDTFYDIDYIAIKQTQVSELENDDTV